MKAFWSVLFSSILVFLMDGCSTVSDKNEKLVVFGCVERSDGQKIQNVWVFLWDKNANYGTFYPKAPPPLGVAKTNKDGEFRFDLAKRVDPKRIFLVAGGKTKEKRISSDSLEVRGTDVALESPHLNEENIIVVPVDFQPSTQGPPDSWKKSP